MTKKLRTIALASMTLFALVSAQAALVSTTTGSDFEDLAKNALGTGPCPPCGSPVALTKQVQHLSFTGATVWHEKQTNYPPYPTGTDAINGYEPAIPVPGKTYDGFVMNRDSSGALVSTLQIDLDPLGPGYITSIEFALLSSTGALEILAWNEARKTYTSQNWTFGGNGVWASQNWTFTEADNFSRIEFRAGSGYIAIDELKVNAEVADTGGAVPEPASLGLVALGFGAAAAATRRRRTS